MFDWNEYYLLAQDLIKRNDELGYRCAISRAYYAAYNIAKSWLIANQDSDKRIKVPNYDNPPHMWVWEQYKEYGGMYASNISNLGRRLKLDRNKADYDPVIKDIEDLAEGVLDDAKQIIDLVHSMT